MKRTIFLILTTIGLLLFATPVAFSQTCADFSFTATPSPSTCQKNGQVAVTVSSAVASLITLSNAQYSIASTTSGGYTTTFVQINDGIIREVPPGTYTVMMRAFCQSMNDWVVSSFTTNVTVGGSYVVPTAYAGAVRKTLNCKLTGMIPVVIAGGKAPYTVTITSAPAAYTGPTSFPVASAGTLNLDNLNDGTYVINVLDQCTYNTPLTVNVGKVASDFPSSVWYPNYLYPSSNNDCGLVKTPPLRNLLGNDDLYYYWVLHPADYYEVAHVWNVADTKTWNQLSSSQTVALPAGETYKTLRASSSKLYSYVRVKGSSGTGDCQTSATADFYPLSVSWYSPEYSCNSYTQSVTPTTVYAGLHCFPLSWKYAEGSCSGTVVASGVIQSGSEIITATGLEYDTTYYLCFEDANGDQWSHTMNRTKTNNAYVTYYNSSCKHGIGLGNVYLYGLGAIDSIRFISGPQAPAVTSLKWTGGGSSYYPYGSTLTNLPEGAYTFELKDTCGFKKQVNTNLYTYKLIGFNLEDSVICDGLRVYPQGQMKKGTDDVYTGFRILSAPAGANVNMKVITQGGYFDFPVSGHYVVQAQYGFNPAECAADTIGINYVRENLSLDSIGTAAYVCPGETAGNFSIKARGGSKNYKYEILGSGLPSNSTGKFQYGTTGATYTAKIYDQTCGTTFEQEITVADLNVASIVWPVRLGGQYCFGDTLALRCLSLGDTDYNWTGPGGYTSTAQNPWRHPATAAMSGLYNVTVKAENCASTMTQGVNINVTGFNTINIGADVKTCENTPFSFSGTVSPAPVSYGWSRSGSILPGSTNSYSDASAAIADSGNYVLTVKNVNNCAAHDTAHVRIVPLYSTWTAQGTASEWNDAQNWDRGIPGLCTYATIPGGKTHYPELVKPVIPGSVTFECDTIDFKFGGEVSRTYLLTYNGAKVNLDVKSFRWTMISAPLRNMYSGDYYLTVPSNRWNPEVHIMKYQSINPQTSQIAISGDWTGSFNTLNKKLDIGLGYAIWSYQNPSGTVSSFSFPKSDMTYGYYYPNGTYGGISDVISDRSHKHRFVYETGSPSQPSATGLFSLDVSGSDMVGAPTTVVGNPFMSHMDFYEFWNANSSRIENRYYIWSSGSFDATSQTAGGFVSTNTSADRYIAPMQSIVVMKKSPSALLNSLNIDPNTMCLTLPGNTLRATQSTSDMLKVELSDANGSSRVVIRYVPEELRGSGSDYRSMYTLFPSRKPAEDEDAAVLYAVEKGKAMSILNLENYAESVELGVRSVRTGEFTLRALNLDDFAPWCSVYLVDKRLGLEQDLRENPVYSFEKSTDGDIVDRFYLRLAGKLTGIEETASSNIRIYSDNGKLHITSDSPIKDVEVSGISGVALLRKNGLNSQSLTFDLSGVSSSQIVIVKVTTEKEQKTEKVIIKN